MSTRNIYIFFIVTSTCDVTTFALLELLCVQLSYADNTSEGIANGCLLYQLYTTILQESIVYRSAIKHYIYDIACYRKIL